jgi:hypothetical protein
MQIPEPSTLLLIAMALAIALERPNKTDIGESS